MTNRRSWSRIARAAVFAVAAPIVLAGCGPSATGGSVGGDVDTDGVTRATEFLAQYREPPTAIGLDVPLDATPEKGKTFVWMQCDSPQCALATSFFEEATAAVGWDLKLVNYETANPATLVAGLKQALRFDPTAVGIVGLPYAVWSSVVPEYDKAGVKIIPMYVGDVPISETVPANIATAESYRTWGRIMANWFIADSKGKGNAKLFTVPELGAAKFYSEGFYDAIDENCSGCTVTDFKLPFADVAAGNAPNAIVSALQQSPETTYFISASVSLTNGLPAALKAAGMDEIQLAGSSADDTQEQAVLTGELQAVTPTALNFGSWLLIDAALREAQGMQQPKDVPINTMLITKESNLTPSKSFDKPADWESQFKKLWKVG